MELQHHHEQLAHRLEELLALGRDRLDAGPEVELRDRAGLRQQHAGHMVRAATANCCAAPRQNAKIIFKIFLLRSSSSSWTVTLGPCST